MLSASLSPIRSIAIIDPLNDFGIGGYAHELAEGLEANGVSVDVYSTAGEMSKIEVPRHHRLIPILGNTLYKRRGLLSGEMKGVGLADAPPTRAKAVAPSKPSFLRGIKESVKDLLLPWELAFYLKKKRYDLVWTQWPHADGYGTRLWRAFRLFGLPVVHTVHNVLPHEEGPKDRKICEAVYACSDVLVVHSRYAHTKLADSFPNFADKAIVSRHGTYTTYPRMPEVRQRIRAALNIAPDQAAFLIFGGVRPYKNIEAVLHAFQKLPSESAVLIIAGVEMGYPDLVEGQPLGRTRRIVMELGLGERVRFIPGRQGIRGTAEIFEAADVQVLPYLESYGSGALLLGMTFGKYIMATAAGGMDEYLDEYPRHTLLGGTSAKDLEAGIEEAMKKLPASNSGTMIPALEWKTIAGQLLATLTQESHVNRDLHALKRTRVGLKPTCEKD